MMKGKWVTVASAGDVTPGEVIGVSIGDAKIAIYNVEHELFATDDVCTHAFARLSEGWLDGNLIECPLHGGQFDVQTGRAMSPPVECDLKTYRVRLLADEIQILIDG